MLTTFDSDEYVYAALRAGASGFLLKDAPSEQLVGAVRSVAAGDALIDPSITRRLITQFVHAARPDPVDPPSWPTSTPRERDVLRLVAQGLSNAEIAAEPRRRGEHGQDPRRPDPHEARPARPGASGGVAYESGVVVPDRS